MTSTAERAACELRDAHRQQDLARQQAALSALLPWLEASLERGGLPSWSLPDSIGQTLRWAELDGDPCWPRLAGQVRALARQRLLSAFSAGATDPDKLALLYAPTARLLDALAAEDTDAVLASLAGLEPVFRADLARWWAASTRARLLHDKGLTDADAVSVAVDRLRDRGLDWKERTHHPYRVTLRWLKTTSYRWVLDQEDSDLRGDVDEARGGKTTSPESLLAQAQELFEQEERARFAREDLVALVAGEKRKKILLLLLDNPELSSLEIALALGDLDPETAEAAGAAAAEARKRACNSVDAQRKYIRQIAAELWRNKVAATSAARKVTP